MLSAVEVLDVKGDLSARLAFDEHLRLCARGRPWPEWTRFEARLAIERSSRVVDLVGRSSAQGHVGTMLVVPLEVVRQLTAECRPGVGHRDSTRGFVFQAENKPLDHGDAAVLADGAEARRNAMAFPAALVEARAGELRPLVGDEVFRLGLDDSHEPAEERSHGDGIRLLAEDRVAHGAAGEVVDDDGDPPAERPALRQGEGPKGGPEAQRGRHEGQVDVPDVVRILGGDEARGFADDRSGVGLGRACVARRLP